MDNLNTPGVDFTPNVDGGVKMNDGNQPNNEVGVNSVLTIIKN